MRRSIVAKVDIPKGKKIEQHELNWVRLNGGLAPGNEKKIINKRTLYKIKLGERIKLNRIK